MGDDDRIFAPFLYELKNFHMYGVTWQARVSLHMSSWHSMGEALGWWPPSRCSRRAAFTDSAARGVSLFHAVHVGTKTIPGKKKYFRQGNLARLVR